MKKIIFILLVLLIPIKVNAISAETAIVMDSYSKRVLFQKNMNKTKLIASTTKIMSAIIAIEYGELDYIVTVDKDVLKAYGSAIYIEEGEELTLKELIYGLLLRSGNDAAIEIANNVTGSMESFVYLMNNLAKKIGMNNTIFYNNHGLEENNGIGNTSTAYDMALLMQYALKNETFKNISSTKEITVKTNKKTYIWYNKNRLLKEYPYTIAGKTGYTEKARRTLVTAAKKDDKELIIVTLNDSNDFSDHENLYEQYFNEYQVTTIINKDDVINNDYYKDNLYVENDYKMMIKENEKDKIKTRVVIDKLDYYEDNDYVGYIEVLFDNEVIYKENIYIKKEEEKETKINIFKKIWDFISFWN